MSEHPAPEAVAARVAPDASENASEDDREDAREAAREDASAFAVRRLRVDLSRGFGRNWLGGDAFRTQFMNALSMSFPVGEQFFIDAVRAGVALLPPHEQARFAPALRGFIGQEATHRHLHGQFNAELERQGLVNHWQHWAARRIARGARLHPRNHVAVTAAYEHFTAVLAHGLLSHPVWLEGAEPAQALLWRWHAVEESEHKSVAIDVYRALGATEKRRRLWFVWVAVLFGWEAMWQTAYNLQRAGVLWRWRTWVQGARFLFGREGLFRASMGPLLQYLRVGFHPADQADPAGLADWLRGHEGDFRVVRAKNA